MDECAPRNQFAGAIDSDVFMNGTVFKPSLGATEQSQLGIGPETSALDPTTKEVVFAPDQKSDGGSVETLRVSGLFRGESPFA